VNLDIFNKAYTFAKLANANLSTYYRCQPKGKSLLTHTSGLAYEKVPGIFAFEDPTDLFDTYTWLHIRKRLSEYEMVRFVGELVDRPADSEGVVVKPVSILSRTPLEVWVRAVMPQEQMTA
jgi:hypothetical protein